MRKISIILASLMLASCAGIPAPPPEIRPSDTASVMRSTSRQLLYLTPPDGPPITVAMYGFTDKTGQRKENDKFSVLSSAVTQGGEVFLIKALQDAGRGKWFQVVERVGLDDLIKERQLIRNQRETYEGKDAKPLSPMLIAGVMIQGGIVGYDTNVGSGGVGAAMLGVGASTQYRTDVVTVAIRLVSVHTGEVLVSAGATKTVLSTNVNGNMIKFVDQGTMAVQMEAGNNINEPGTTAVKMAAEAAVVDMIKQGVDKGLWQYKQEEKAPAAASTSQQQ